MGKDLPRRRWLETAAAAADCVDRLARELGLPRPVAAVLAGRGLDNVETVTALMTPRLSELGDPLALPGMQAGAERVLRALRDGERLVVFGDFDADGVTATALLAGVLRRLGGQVSVFTPCRFDEGYGFTLSALKRCLACHKPALIVTVDCGTNAVDTVAAAQAAGVEVLVTDHHEPAPDRVTDAVVINPVLGGGQATRDLAGVGVAFKLCHAVIKLARQAGATAALDLRDWLELVAIGTIADVAPLTGENRILVKHGLDRMAASCRPGVRALLQVAGVRDSVTVQHVGYQLAPRLNAAGRLASGAVAVDLLLADSEAQAESLAQELDAANTERRRVETAMRSEAEAGLNASFDPASDYGLVAAGEGWHVGAIGIVASRVLARYHRPAVVIALNGAGQARGSGRSVEGVNLVEVLEGCSEWLTTFGGHELAAGLSMRAEAVPDFRRAFNAACRERLTGRDLRPAQRVDAWVTLAEMDAAVVEAMDTLSPFGVGHPVPVFGARGVRIVGQPRRVGATGDHLKLLLAEGGRQLDAIAFGFGPYTLPDGPLDVLFEFERNTFRGMSSLQLQIRDMAAARGTP